MDDDDDDDDDYYHHHNMATNLKVIMYFCSDTLPLVDMYNLDGLKEIIVCNLRIEKCHLFHKVRVSILSSVFSCSSTALVHNILAQYIPGLYCKLYTRNFPLEFMAHVRSMQVKKFKEESSQV